MNEPTADGYPLEDWELDEAEGISYGYPQHCRGCQCHAMPAPPSREKRIKYLRKRIKETRAHLARRAPGSPGSRMSEYLLHHHEEELDELLWETWLDSRDVVYRTLPRK